MTTIIKKIIFSPSAAKEYNFWLKTNPKITQKISNLIISIISDGLLTGLGKPESLRGRTEYSRRINKYHRLIYYLDEKNNLIISSCLGHYD
jgi:toxin YoeB